MTEKKLEEDDGWDRGWEEHKIRQLVRLARLPLPEKIAWLESAQAFCESVRRAHEHVESRKLRGS